MADDQLTRAKAAEERLQHGAVIPGAVDAATTPPLEPPATPLTAVPETTPPLPSTPADQADDKLEGGGRY